MKLDTEMAYWAIYQRKRTNLTPRFNMPEKLGHPRYLQSSDRETKSEHLSSRILNQRQFLIDQNIREKYVRHRSKADGEVTLTHQGERNVGEHCLAQCARHV